MHRLKILSFRRLVQIFLFFTLIIPVVASATIVRMETTFGVIEIELFDDVAPQTVANFLNYVSDGDYDGSFIHRSFPGFIVQGGGFTFDDEVGQIPTDPPVVNEFNLSNLRGTIAMAKIGGDPDSATNQWFFNLGDNSGNLDNQNGGFTVFGQVRGSGMDVVDDIAALQIVNAGGAFTDLPVVDWTGGEITAENLVFVIRAQVIKDVRPAVIAVPDTTNDQVTEAALSRAGSVQVEVRNGSSGAQLSNSTYHSDPFTPAGIIAIPDVSGNNLAEIGALGVDDTGAIKLRVADAATSTGIRNMTYYSSGHDPVDLATVTDVSGNALADVAVLVQRQSDNRVFVKIKDAASGATAGTVEFLDAGFTPLGLAVLADIDSSGSDELVVFATRNSDGRGLVEIREADGTAGKTRIWYLDTNFTPVGIAIGDDANNNGIPEIAMLAERNSDQRIVIERRNASGAPQTTRHWYFSAGWQVVDFAAVSDTNADNLPEYAVLAIRNDGKPAVEIRNAGNPKATFRRFFMDENFTALQVVDMGDTNGNGGTNLGVLGLRNSDDRPKMETRDARGNANTKNIWFAP